MLKNKLIIINEVELAKAEERITKIKALELFDDKTIESFEIGSFNSLLSI